MLNERYGDIEVIYKKMPPLNSPRCNYPGFVQESRVLAKGWTKEPGTLPLPCDIRWDRDVEIPLRDGTKIYCDIFRREGAGKIPAILCWGPAGRRGMADMLDGFPNRMGIPKSALSGLQGWESADPAHWCHLDYAVVEVDPRGAYMSEGNVQMFGPQDALDIYDGIEWLATQDWCSGNVGMSGNSWYAMVQWFAATERPPHLKCIAPWEGHADLYREEYVKGGIPRPNIFGEDATRSYGDGLCEDIDAMLLKYPLMNDYWRSKIPDIEKIEIPAYVVASYTNGCHTHGTFTAFNRLSSREKWLRVHAGQEWPDYYSAVSRADLKRFFDRYLKGIENGWEATPRVRMSVLDPGGTDIPERAETSFPPERMRERRLYLDAGIMAMSEKPIEGAEKTEYDGGDNKSSVSFTYRMENETELAGNLSLRLWVEADGGDDLDINVLVCKLDSGGKQVFHNCLSHMYPGPSGVLRASHRALDAEKSTPCSPFHTHEREEKLRPGEIVPVDIPIWPTAMLFHRGEILEVVVAGHDLVPPALPGYELPAPHFKSRCVIHTGGRYDSCLIFTGCEA